MADQDHGEGLETAVFAGGCFWCTEAVFRSLRGIVSVEPGYSGGDMVNPTYDEVSTGRTGHVEAVRIVFRPDLISYSDLLTVFFFTHDPTTAGRQGNDVGQQYSSVIFHVNREQKRVAESFIRELAEQKAYEKPILTEVRPLKAFYPAEDYHRRYYETHREDRYCELVIAPKLEKLQRKFASLLQDESH